MKPATIKIIYPSDGEIIAKEIEDHFGGMNNIVVEDHGRPVSGNIDIVIFVLTSLSLKDKKLHNVLNQCIAGRAQILPVVEDLDNYDFTKLPPELDSINKLNSLGWKSPDPLISDGEKVLQTINCWIGAQLFERERQLFISYRRSDGEKRAYEIYNYFKDKEYRVFLDKEKIPGAMRVQRYIEQAIFDHDFLLLIDSPDAKDSEWIRREIEIAIQNRIKIVVLRLPGGKMPLHNEVRVIDYRGAQKLIEVEAILKEEIKRRRYFDLKIIDALDELVINYGLEFKRYGTRKVLITDSTAPGSPKNVLMEFEDTPHSLESLYRLNCSYEDYLKIGASVSSAFFVYAGRKLSQYQKKAVYWARNSAPLDMVTLDEFVFELLK